MKLSLEGMKLTPDNNLGGQLILGTKLWWLYRNKVRSGTVTSERVTHTVENPEGEITRREITVDGPGEPRYVLTPPHITESPFFTSKAELLASL